MHPSALRDRLVAGARAFAWDEWAQMGFLASPTRASLWAQDPEALILFSLEVGRDDPRLFDELLDWLLVNESLLSVRRLRGLCDGPDDERLVDAALGWVAQHRPRARLASRARAATFDRAPDLLFRGLGADVRRPDAAFAAAGWLRSATRPSRKSRRPDLRAPVNLSFRLRELLGVGVRAEVVRFLLTVVAPSADARTIAASACFSKRNVHGALTALHDAGVVRRWTVGNEQRYTIADRAGWAHLLDVAPADLPTEQPWPQLLHGLRILLRWVQQPGLAELSDYMRASHARDVLEAVRGDFAYAGVDVGRSTAEGAWVDLEALVEDVLLRLAPGSVGDARHRLGP